MNDGRSIGRCASHCGRRSPQLSASCAAGMTRVVARTRARTHGCTRARTRSLARARLARGRASPRRPPGCRRAARCARARRRSSRACAARRIHSPAVRARMRWMEVCACVLTHMRARRRTRTKRTRCARSMHGLLRTPQCCSAAGPGGQAAPECLRRTDAQTVYHITAVTKLRSAQCVRASAEAGLGLSGGWVRSAAVRHGLHGDGLGGLMRRERRAPRDTAPHGIPRQVSD